ncbi:sensor histidine kinase [Oceanirhabdus seepicola]|uniref:GHKL domain-containing protein n=1 Tax=Oceanirhabdus seepicola TaxID=2828781 RepID=A0A9J6NY53_9CLOT|nr:sensor histidine kinase [Oceanirhabdus seepicola]MCM1988918.1 GHKL domain-containing protein [Oceanirhabdus seepicola]
MNDLLSIVSEIIKGIYFYKLVNKFVCVKENKFIKFIAFFSMFAISGVIIYNADVVNISYTMLLFFVVMLTCYRGTKIEKISIIMVLYPIVVALNFITKDISVKLYFSSSQTLFMSNLCETITILSCIFWVVIYKIFGDKFKKASSLIDYKTWLLVDLICLAPFISIYATIIFTPSGKEYQAYFIALACIITNLGVIYLIEYIAESIRIKAENRNLKLEYSYYQELLNNQQEVRKLRHDINNHLGVVSAFLENKDLEGAKEYFECLSDKFQVSNRQFCNNSIVNAVINAKYNFALENNIDCFFNISIDKVLPIEDIDLCSIFANTLDNAIEASLKINKPSQRKITVKALLDKGYFSYNITNTIGSKVNFFKGKYISDKEDKKLHGFGIENVSSIVKKYNGIIDINYSETNFEVLIVIKVN